MRFPSVLLFFRDRFPARSTISPFSCHSQTDHPFSHFVIFFSEFENFLFYEELTKRENMRLFFLLSGLINIKKFFLLSLYRSRRAELQGAEENVHAVRATRSNVRRIPELSR